MRPITIALAASVLAACALFAAGAAAAAKPPKWTVYADCSAYYQVNAYLAGPDRPATMTAQMSEVVADYARTATARYVKQRKASPHDAQHAVAARIKAAIERLGAKPPRKTVEKLIDKCPRPDG